MRSLAFLCFGIVVSAAAAEIPDCSLAAGWQQAGPRRTFEGESLYEYMNGNSEGYLVYGFKKMNGVTCKKGDDTIHVDVSDMGDAESAYGIFCANRDVRTGLEELGTSAQITPRKATIAKDRFYLEIAAEPEKDHSAALKQLAAALEKQVAGSTALPEQISWFPTADLQPGWPRLVPQSVLGIRLLKRGYVAQYTSGAKAFIVKEASAAAASATAAKLRERLSATESAGLGEGGYSGADKYLGRMIVFTAGPYVAGYAGVPDGQDAVALGKGLESKLRK